MSDVLLWGAAGVSATFLLIWLRTYITPCTICGRGGIQKISEGRCQSCNEKYVAERRLEEQKWAEDERRKKARLLETLQQKHRERETIETKRFREVHDLLRLNGEEFEQLSKIIFERKGYKVVLTKKAGDGGIDPWLERDGRKEIVQCKNWKDRVSVETVRELFGVLHKEKAKQAWLVSTSGFTASAKQFAEGEPIQLVNGGEFLRTKSELGLGNSDRDYQIEISCENHNCFIRLRIPGGRPLKVKCPCGREFLWDAYS